MHLTQLSNICICMHLQVYMYNKITQVNVQTHKVSKQRRNEQRATKEKLQLSSKGLWPLILYALSSKSYTKDNNAYGES